MAEEYRSYKGTLKVLEKVNDFIYEMELWLLSDVVNRNNWQYTDLEGHREMFCGVPILCAYIGNRVGDGHNFRMVRDRETGEEYASFTDATAERIVGAMSDDPADMRIEEIDGVKWVVGKGFLWAWYARELVDKIERFSETGQEMSLSIETLVTKAHMNGEVEVEDEYIILGVTLLGDGVMPAVEDARVVTLQEITGEFEQLKLRAASYINGSDEGEEEEEENPEDEPHTKPQQNKTQRRVGMKALSKAQLALLSDKFEGYTVLGGGTDDAGVSHICLMSADGIAATYETDNLSDSVIVPEKIRNANAQVCYEVGEETIAVDSMIATDSFSAQIITLTSDLTKANSTIASLTEEVNTMKANEQARRITAAKAKAVDTLNKFNANREEKVSEDILTKINESIDNKEYSDCLNSEGQWVGESKVEEAVLAACAVKVMEMDKISAEKNNSQYVWSGMEGRPADAEGIDGLLASFGIQ